MGSYLSVLLRRDLTSVWSRLPSDYRKLVTYILPLIGLFYIFAIKPFLSPLRKMPGLPYHPLFGNIREAIKGEAMETSVRWVTKYGGILRYYGFFGRENVLVADPEAMKRILVTHTHKYGRPIPRDIPLGRSVLTVTGDEHKVLRRLLNPVFSPESIKGYLPVFEEFAHRLVDYWSKELGMSGAGNLDVQTDMFRTTFDVFGKAVLGYDFGSLVDPNAEMVKTFKKCISLDSVSYRGLIPFYKYLPTAENQAKSRSLKTVNETIAKLIAEKQALLDEAQGLPADAKLDLLTRLILARDEETGQGLTSREMRDQLFTLIFAGYETTAMTMSWILLTLAQNQHIQVKVRAEVKEVLQGKGQMTWEDVTELKYLDRVIKEGQRLYPAAANVPRYVKEEDQLGGYTVPRGTPITCHIGTLMRNPAVWDDPETFNPDRFLDGGATSRLYSYLPFGSGPTKCLGHLFARVQMRVLLAVLVRSFQFDTIPGHQVKRKHRVLLQAVPPIMLHVSRPPEEG